MHWGRERDKVGLAHAHTWERIVRETNESRGVGDLIGDTNNCVCSTIIMLSFCLVACSRTADGLSELSGKAVVVCVSCSLVATRNCLSLKVISNKNGISSHG